MKKINLFILLLIFMSEGGADLQISFLTALVFLGFFINKNGVNALFKPYEAEK